jgi:hypothetical protein
MSSIGVQKQKQKQLESDVHEVTEGARSEKWQ